MLPSWIFQRGDERLTLHTRENNKGVTLVVRGSAGGDLRSYWFNNYPALVKFETEMEEFLLATGWSPTEVSVQARSVAVAPKGPAGALRAAARGPRAL